MKIGKLIEQLEKFRAQWGDNLEVLISSDGCGYHGPEPIELYIPAHHNDAGKKFVVLGGI